MQQLISLSESVIPYKRHINSVLMNRDEIESWMVTQCFEECDTFFKNLFKGSDLNEIDINITNEFENLLFACLLRCLVGNSDEIVKNCRDFRQNLLFLLNNFNNFYVQNLPSWWPFGIRKQYNDTHKWFSQTIDKAYFELQDANNTGLSYLKHLIDNPLRGREKDIKHVFAMLYGATVNTIPSILLALVTVSMNEHREYLDKLMKFIDDLDDMNEMNISNLWKYDELDRVLNETLRLYPVRIITRVTKCRIKLDKTGFTVPKNSWFIMSPYLIHRDNKNYKNSNKFVPDRWIDEKYVRYMKSEGKYMNFGFGAHSCMGRRFATMLFKTFFICCLKNYKIVLAHNNCYDVIYRSKKRGFTNNIFGKLVKR